LVHKEERKKMKLFTTTEVNDYFNKTAQTKRDKNQLALSELEAIDFIVQLLNSEHDVKSDVANLKKLIRK
tara:strand:+ start:3572 stop:3781 length:210 start_codon:yes stop_codon:yes gene_type:complete